MKKFAILIFVLALIIVSCTKNATDILYDNLEGDWLLKESAGGLSYHIEIPHDKIIITFKNPGEKYITTVNDSITEKGVYALAKDSSGNYYSSTTINLYAGNDNKHIYGIQIRNDSLFLSDGCCDGFVYAYIRQ